MEKAGRGPNKEGKPGKGIGESSIGQRTCYLWWGRPPPLNSWEQRRERGQSSSKGLAARARAFPTGPTKAAGHPKMPIPKQPRQLSAPNLVLAECHCPSRCPSPTQKRPSQDLLLPPPPLHHPPPLPPGARESHRAVGIRGQPHLHGEAKQ